MMKRLIFIFMVIALAQGAWAGWVEVRKELGDSGKVVFQTKTFYEDGKMRNFPEDGDDQWSVFDLKNGTITMVSPKAKTYWKGPLKDYVDFMKSMTEQMREMMGGSVQAPKVTVERSGSGGKINGLSTVKYKVFVNGKLKEEKWVASDAPIFKENEKYMKKLQEEMQPMQKHMHTGSKEYMSLEVKGWTMKEVEYESFGNQTVKNKETVYEITKKSLSSSDFAVPKGYKKVATIKELMDKDSSSPSEGRNQGAFSPPPSYSEQYERPTQEPHEDGTAEPNEEEQSTTSEEKNAPSMEDVKEGTKKLFKSLF